MAPPPTARDPRLPAILRIDELRAVEAAHAGEPLMERAGRAAAEIARSMHPGSGPIVVCAGPGNNGGDAFVAARWLRSWFFEVVTVFAGDASRLPSDAAAAYASFRAAGGTTTDAIPSLVPALIVDGLFGIGMRRAPSGVYASMITWANDSGAPILALDAPSGLDAATGAAYDVAIRADATATFIALKPGLLTGDGPDLCGVVSVHSLDLVDVDAGASGHRLDWPTLAPALPDVLLRRRRNVHKGTFGTLAVLGGASGMVGAPILAARAALKLGAGRVRVGFVSSDHPSIDWGAPELMLGAADAVIDAAPDAIVIGPGLGTSDAARNTLQRAIAAPVPLVVDADALNLIARHASLRESVRARTAPTCATPHPAEAARLLGCDTAAIGRDRVDAASRLAADLNAAIVLKGVGSVLAYADGSFDINATGGPALATGGSGDVLSGMLGALVAQRIDARTALRYAVCMHGAAADAIVARGEPALGVTASEIADAARGLIAGVEVNAP